MVRVIKGLLAACILSCCVGWGVFPMQMSQVETTPAPTLIVDEDFEGTGAPVGWSVDAGFDPDYTTDPLAGSQSGFTQTLNNGAATFTFTPQSEIYVGCMVKIPTFALSGTTWFIALRNGTSDQATARTRNGTTTRNYHGTVTIDGSLFTENQTTYIWLHYIKSTGASDGVLEMWAGSTGVFNDATLLSSGSTGNATLDIDNIELDNGNTLTASGIIFDNLKVASSPIGDM